MRGEDRREAGSFNQILILGPADRGVVRIGAQQGFRQTAQRRVVCGRIDTADIGGQSIGARGKGGIAEMLDQRRDGGQIEVALVDPPGYRQGDQKDGITERILFDAGT